MIERIKALILEDKITKKEATYFLIKIITNTHGWSIESFEPDEITDGIPDATILGPTWTTIPGIGGTRRQQGGAIDKGYSGPPLVLPIKDREMGFKALKSLLEDDLVDFNELNKLPLFVPKNEDEEYVKEVLSINRVMLE